MNLSLLTSPDLVALKTEFSDYKQAIETLADKLEKAGKLHNKEAFLEAVYAREEQGPTALGESLAIPHGKSDAVKEAAFAAATLKRSIPWQGIDGDEQVELIFLLAIPMAEAGSTHMMLLTNLTTALVDDETRNTILNAQTYQQFIDALQPTTAESQTMSSANRSIVCVTACPAGIAHTYMAAEYLEKAGKKLGINIRVEKQGANGQEGRITTQEAADADACIIAAEVAIKEIERFSHLPTVKTTVADPIKNAEKLILQALELAEKTPKGQPVQATSSAGSQETKKVSLLAEVKQALLNGVSHVIPIIFAGIILLAFASLITKYYDLQTLAEQKNSWLWMYYQLSNNLLVVFIAPIISAYVAYSIADKPALGPGFATGIAANLVGAGFLGGFIGGILAGYLMRFIKTYVRISPTFNGFLMFFFYPVLGTLTMGSLMLFLIGKPLAKLNNSLTTSINAIADTNTLLYVILFGAMCLFIAAGFFKTAKSSASTTSFNDQEKNQISRLAEVKQALLSGISYAVPLIVAGGMTLAFAVLVAQAFDLQYFYDTADQWLWMYRKLGGGLLGILMVPVISAYVAYSLAGKPALAPGFVAGIAANIIGSGFLGGLAGGFIAGYLMRFITTYIRSNSAFNIFITYFLYPVIGSFIAGSLMILVVGKPVALINTGLTNWLDGLAGANALLLGAVLGAMCSFDLGGPVNKASYAFCLGAMANGVYGPYATFASVKMVSAFTVTAATMLAPKLFKDFEIETGKSTWLLGLAGITEGAIPMAIEDPLRVLSSFIVGSAVTGAIVAASGIGLATPGAGIFSIFLLDGADKFTAASIWVGAALLGTLISTIMLITLRKYAANKTATVNS